MARYVFVLFAVVVLAALAATTTATSQVFQPYHVTGRAYCDCCRFGFETNITKYIPGAIVDLQCIDKSDSSKIVYTTRVKTDSSGTFKFVVPQDHGDQNCDVVLKKSPWAHCKNRDRGRYKSRVIVTDFNGIISRHRYANNLGFLQNYAEPECAQLHKFYFHSDDQ